MNNSKQGKQKEETIHIRRWSTENNMKQTAN